MSSNYNDICHTCKGKGYIDGMECSDCFGEGVVSQDTFQPKTKLKKFKEFSKDDSNEIKNHGQKKKKIKEKRKEKNKNKFV